MNVQRSFLVTTAIGPALLVAILLVRPAAAAVILSASGTTSGMSPVPIAAQAQFTLSGTTLSLVLSNISPGSSTSANQMLSSFYFDIIKGGIRPTLTYESATGFVWKLISSAADEPFNYVPPVVAGGPGTFTLATGTVTHVPSDLKAVKDNDRTWQFRSMNSGSDPFLGFGIGTVGNGGYGGGGGNGFTEAIVGPPGPDFIAFAIYKNGDIQPVGAPVQNQFLVLNSATLTFSSAALAGYTEADITPRAVFGFGTGPDTVLIVPEPGGLALLLIGGLLGGLVWLSRSLISTVGIAAVVIVLLVASGPVQANPIPVTTFDFSTGPQKWVATNVAYNNKPPAGSTWLWQAGEWKVEPVSVLSSFNWVGNELTSPRIVVPEDVDALEFTMLHRFNFPVNISNAQPIVAGQVVYRIFDVANPSAPFLPLSPSVFATGSISPPLSPFPDWVAPNYLVPAALPPLVAPGGGWKGASPGFTAGTSVATRWVIDGGLTTGQEVQVRLINANLGRECDGGLWEVSSVTVVGLLPEPSTCGMAALAAGVGLVARLTGGRRRFHQRASRPSVSPLTNTLPPVSVA